jgi:sugar transferase (PEP-CTERM/EpsH1 system associated)
MNILFVCHRIPYPPNKGDKIRSFNEIKFLSEGHNIFLATTLDEPSDSRYLPELEKYTKKIYATYFSKKGKLIRNAFSNKPFSVANFYDRSIQEFVDETLQNNDINAVICFCSSMAEYIFMSKAYRNKGSRPINLIMDFVDLDSDKWLQYAKYAKFPLSLLFTFENRRLSEYELKINELFDETIFVSGREVDVFQEVYPEAKNINVIPNGVDTEYFTPAGGMGKTKWLDLVNKVNGLWENIKRENNILVFTGFMDYFANEDGVEWFCRYIFPKIRSAVPNTEFFIVGNRPTNLVWALSEMEGVNVTGYVEDIREYYWMADVCVMPLRIARGLQNKVLEAMATGNAVVSTSNASDGIICHKGVDIVIEDNEDEFSQAVISLLQDKDKRERIGKMAVENIRRYYSWKENLVKLKELLAC